MSKVKLGLIGCGVIGEVTMAQIQKIDDAKLVAVADLNEALLEKCANLYNIDRMYLSGEDLLNDGDIDAVILAIPAFLHKPLALKAISKGKHVLLEKPAAINSSEITELLKISKNLKIASFSSRLRFMQSYNKIKDFIKKGNLGSLKTIRVKSINPIPKPPSTPPPSWRLSKKLNGGGLLMNWGVYDLDFIMGLFDWKLNPKKVYANVWKFNDPDCVYTDPNSDAENHYVALIKCQDNISINMERGEFVVSKPEGSIDIIGDNGAIHLRTLPNENQQIHFVLKDKTKGVFTENIISCDDNWQDAHFGPVENFIEAILGNVEIKTDLKKTLMIQELIDATYKSAENNECVSL